MPSDPSGATQVAGDAAQTLVLEADLIAEKVREALEEDLGRPPRDLTTQALVPETLEAEAILVARGGGVVAGMPVAREVFRQLDPDLTLTARAAEGQRVDAGATIAEVRGRLASILTGERVALNFLQRLSGIATLTRSFVDAAGGHRASIYDTRKTSPGLRALERYAVRAGGGRNHRRGLFDAVLVKDNHLAAAGGVEAVLSILRRGTLPAQLEVDDLGQLEAALAGGAGMILLDNMTPAGVAEAVALVAGRAVLEVSGGVTLANVAAYAATGVERISVGALTHSAPALDIALDIERTWPR